MQPVDWKLVYAKASELYTRYQAGLTYSQIEAELKGQDIDSLHINYVVEELNKRLQEEKQQQLNKPLLAVSILLAILFVVGLVLIMHKGYVAIAAVVGIFVFIVARAITKRNPFKLQRPNKP